MKKRNRIITSLILTASLILGTYTCTFADTPVENTDIDSASICSAENGKFVYDWFNGFRILNDPEWFCTKIDNTDVILVSYTNFETHPEQEYEKIQVNAYYDETPSFSECPLHLYNNGQKKVSDNTNITILCDKEFKNNSLSKTEPVYINSNFFDLTEDEMEHLSLGDAKKRKGQNYGYEPIPGFVIDIGNKDDYTNAYMEIVHDNYDPSGSWGGLPQTWIKITFFGGFPDDKEDNNIISSDNGIPEWVKEGKVREFIGDNGDYIETVSENLFTGKKIKPVVTVSYNGNTYSSEKGGLLKVKYSKNKNAGEVTATITKVKGKSNKSVSNFLKGKNIKFKIIPITVSDNNIRVKWKDTTVKSVKVLTGGKYKKVSKKMWRQNGDKLDFSGNYSGSVSLNIVG